MDGVIFHVVFTIKNSRYDWQKIRRKMPVGFIAHTFPFLEGEEEENVIKILIDLAGELELRLAAFNMCGDHVHAVLRSDISEISNIMGLWKGKASYLYNRKIYSLNNGANLNNQIVEQQNLWARGFFKKIIANEQELYNVINYVKFNRKKHGLPPLTSNSTNIINNLTDGFSRRKK